MKEKQVFIDRFRAKATKATQVKSREKQLAKIEKLEAPRVETRTIALRFPPAKPSYREVLTLQNIGKRYGAQTVLDGLALTLERGERLALIGPNEGRARAPCCGCWPTSSSPIAARCCLEPGVTVGYYAQDQTDVLDVNRTVLEEAWAAAPGRLG